MENYWRQEYEARMRLGRREYADIIETLSELGLPTEFTQTGGMNAALEVQLETGAHLLVTDAEESLAWHCGQQQGWRVGLYTDPEHSDGPERFESTESNEVDALIEIIKQVLAPDPHPPQRYAR